VRVGVDLLPEKGQIILSNIKKIEFGKVVYEIVDANLLYQGEFEYLQIIVDFCIEPRSVQEIMDKFGLDSRTSFRRKYLTPMLEKDVLKMTIPEKPSSKN